MRLPVIAVAAIAVLGLFYGSADAARLRYPTVENPYCRVATYVLRELPEQAMSTVDSSKQPVIVVSRNTLSRTPAYGQFLMAHECCHHTLGHVERYSGKLGGVGPQAFFYIQPALRQMELDADCCAVKLLRERNTAEGIDAARMTMLSFGNAPTGAHYPTGVERAENISACGAAD